MGVADGDHTKTEPHFIKIKWTVERFQHGK